TLGGTPIVDSASCGFTDGSVTGITVSGGTPGYSYQWYNGSTPIPGATTATLTAAGAGNYSVAVIDANGCQAVGGINTFTVGSSSTISSTFTASVNQGTAPLDVLFTSTTAT